MASSLLRIRVAGNRPLADVLLLADQRQPMGDGRQFVTASDDAHPLLKDLPMVQTYPVEMRWRVAARFDAFDKTKMIPISDIRGGSTEYPAVGRLTFRIGDQEQQLTAFGFPGSGTR